MKDAEQNRNAKQSKKAKISSRSSSDDYNDDMSEQTHLMKCAGVSGMKRRQAAQMTICVLRLGGLGLGGLGLKD